MTDIYDIDNIINKYSPYFNVSLSLDELTLSPLIIFKLLNSNLVYSYKYTYSVINVNKIDEIQKQIHADLSSIVRDINIDKIIK
jgi:hypothetical protein